uniref:Ion_trans domain-containing protein n=1 Tax=Steinernema glaseri TaxID=37863 RepID=A0A1I7XX53_9BILA
MFGKTLQASFRQLGMMAMVVLTGVIFFSTLVYFLEKDEPGSHFHSIPAACWWCIVTMTTVGYGDLTPVTVPGKLVATGAIACGVLVLALPITIIVDNFMKVAEGERRPAEGQCMGLRRLGPRARVTMSENVEAVFSPTKPLSRRRLRQSMSLSSTAPLNDSSLFNVSSGNNGRIALPEEDVDC